MRLFVCLLLVAVVLCGDPGSQNNNDNPRYVLSVKNAPQKVNKVNLNSTGLNVDALVLRTQSVNQFSSYFKPETGVGPHRQDLPISKVRFDYYSSVDKKNRRRQGMACQIDCLSTVEGVTIFNNDPNLNRYYSYGANADLGCFDYQTKNTSDVETALKICTEINKFTYNQQFLKRVGKNETAAQYIVKKKLVGSFTTATVLRCLVHTLVKVLPRLTDANAAVMKVFYLRLYKLLSSLKIVNLNKINNSSLKNLARIVQQRIMKQRNQFKKSVLAYEGSKKLKFIPVNIHF
ncbi:hypothetical protein AKO1_001218 [Acrasis kona]|uniref:Uncharacterized protein n=1 Tax=Acrasis kona TaxID=1008807 RepID=A0AAW2ZBN5_9EUKA